MRRRPRTLQREENARQPERTRDARCQRRRLVVAARNAPVPVQRDRHDELRVVAQKAFALRFGPNEPERLGQRFPGHSLHFQNDIVEFARIRTEPKCGRKVKRAIATLRTTLADIGVRADDTRTPWAEYVRVVRNFAGAIGANGVVGTRAIVVSFADETKRRVDPAARLASQIAKGVQHANDPAGYAVLRSAVASCIPQQTGNVRTNRVGPAAVRS